MKLHLLIAISLILLVGCSLPKPTQKDFEGKFIYKIRSNSELEHSNHADSSNYQVVFAKDSMLRIESFTPIGKQVYIKHIPKNRAYILMDIGEKVAIQTIPDTTIDNSYSYSYKNGKIKFADIKANNILVTDNELDTTITMNYYPKISPKYSTAMQGIPGLPVKYQLFTDNSWLTYELIKLEEKEIDINLFGIPSDYRIITLDQFMDYIREND